MWQKGKTQRPLSKSQKTNFDECDQGSDKVEVDTKNDDEDANEILNESP